MKKFLDRALQEMLFWQAQDRLGSRVQTNNLSKRVQHQHTGMHLFDGHPAGQRDGVQDLETEQGNGIHQEFKRHTEQLDGQDRMDEIRLFHQEDRATSQMSNQHQNRRPALLRRVLEKPAKDKQIQDCQYPQGIDRKEPAAQTELWLEYSLELKTAPYQVSAFVCQDHPES